MKIEDIPEGILARMHQVACEVVRLPVKSATAQGYKAAVNAAVKVLLGWQERESSYELEEGNPYSNPNNWRAVLYDNQEPTYLDHGNLVTVDGTGQVLLEYVGPEVQTVKSSSGGTDVRQVPS